MRLSDRTIGFTFLGLGLALGATLVYEACDAFIHVVEPLILTEDDIQREITE